MTFKKRRQIIGVHYNSRQPHKTYFFGGGENSKTTSLDYPNKMCQGGLH